MARRTSGGPYGKGSIFRLEHHVGPANHHAAGRIRGPSRERARVFSVAVFGASPLSYQWQKNGNNLIDHRKCHRVRLAHPDNQRYNRERRPRGTGPSARPTGSSSGSSESSAQRLPRQPRRLHFMLRVGRALPGRRDRLLRRRRELELLVEPALDLPGRSAATSAIRGCGSSSSRVSCTARTSECSGCSSPRPVGKISAQAIAIAARHSAELPREQALVFPALRTRSE